MIPTRNWCNSHELVDDSRNIALTSEDAAAWLSESAGAVRPLGARFSWPELIDAREGTAIHLSNVRHILEVSDSSITVTGDCLLSEMWDELRSHGRTLPPCPPVITAQTVAGALGTGTHAQGRTEGLLADAVISLDYLDALGRPRHVERTDDSFGGWALHLGSLGLITAATFETVPNREYHCAKFTTGTDEMLSSFNEWFTSLQHLKSWWFVDDGRAHTWQVSTQATRREGVLQPRTDLNSILRAAQDNIAADTTVASDSAAPQRTIGRFYDYTDSSGDLVDIFRNGIPAPQVNMEVGVPLDRFIDAARDLREMLANHQHRLHYPVILRPTGPSQAWLASNYERATCWFGFVVYQRPDGSVAPEAMELMRDVQRVLSAHDGFPHWGKYFDPTFYDFDLLPRTQDFRALRARLDPTGRFLNPRVATVLGC